MNTGMIVLGSKSIALPEGTGMTTVKRGKGFVPVLAFAGKTYAELNEAGRADGLKGKALKRFRQAAFRGDLAKAAWVRHDGILSAARSAGFVPAELKPLCKGEKLNVTYVRPDEIKVAAPAPDVSGIIARLKAKGHSDAEIAEILGA